MLPEDSVLEPQRSPFPHYRPVPPPQKLTA